ncbi:alpha-hydroxy acid oxidase [Micromonospora echinofusca]|uniref:Alpha-hydroxy-acid oxidizing protein n=1 Tax=Micromonospora echinofusca TaxID=47858 RepID=A0ABS3VWW8_MICEH|nr:alpha-hydroxy acid oxidase [Micromonospora echinofusca]MBO4209035.1 alpha-hydroxy-acid oxidizing protein [Micromonospora echinofusca]
MADPGVPVDCDTAVCLADLAELARRVLPAAVYDFVAGGSGAETTLAGNRAALDRVAVLPRVLTGTADPDLSARLPGGVAALPVAAAPMAYQRLVHPDGELALARASAAAGVPFVASTLSSYPIEEIAAVAGPLWFQLYWLRDRSLVRALLARAEAAGATAMMVTVDVPLMARRLRDVRNAFTLPETVVAANLTRDLAAGLAAGPDDRAHLAATGVSAVAAHTADVFAPALTWQDIEWLRGQTDLPLVVKGLLDPRDAALAVEAGADAVVVSNHGGRQFDGAPPSIVALPAVVDAVAGRAQVLLDSGVASGTDVLRALAGGAAGVLVGRPLLWALAAGGERGARRAFDLLRAELSDALTLAGCADVAGARDLRTLTIGGTR